MSLPRSSSGLVFLLAVSLVTVRVWSAAAQESNPSTDKPVSGDGESAEDAARTAIRKSADEFLSTFNDHDAKALANQWTPDGEYINENGLRFEGREAIAEEYSLFFKANPNVQLQLSVDSIRLISPTSAIEDGRTSLDPLPPGAPRMSRYTAIHVKQDGEWKMASVRDQRLESPSNYGFVRQLEWLVGDWSAEEMGTRAEVSGRWIANKSFLERKITITKDGHADSSSVEIVGWDPKSRRFMSWIFASGGGRSEGVWSLQGDGWVVESRGLLPDGTQVTSTNVWTLLLDGSLGWQSVGRSVAGLQLSDIPPVILKTEKADE